MQREWQQGDFVISTDPARLDLGLIHHYLAAESYWAAGRTREAVVQSIAHSLAFGIYQGERQVGFARLVTDYATLAWLCDVFVLEAWRGQGLSKWLLQIITSLPELQGLRRWLLATRDAHELYRRYGFKEIAPPDCWMERTTPQKSELLVSSDPSFSSKLDC